MNKIVSRLNSPRRHKGRWLSFCLLGLALWNLGLFDNANIDKLNIESSLRSRDEIARLKFMDPLDQGMFVQMQYFAEQSINKELRSGMIDLRTANGKRSLLRRQTPKVEEHTIPKMAAVVSFDQSLPYLHIQYWKNMPLAFLYLLLVLWRKEKLNKRFLSKKNAVAMGINLIFYPIALMRIVYFAIRSFFAEAYVRRSADDAYILMSDEMEKRIGDFANGKHSLRDWKRSFLIAGFLPKRSLALAMLATFVLMIVPRIAKSNFESKTNDNISKPIMRIVKCIGLESLDKIDYEITMPQEKNKDCVSEDLSIQTGVRIYRLYTEHRVISPQEVMQKIRHVPIFNNTQLKLVAKK